MDDVVWGAEIAVDGKKPDWLAGDEVCAIFDDGNWLYGCGENPARGWCWVNVSAFKLLADHPHYHAPSGADGSSYYDIHINGVTVSCNDVIDALGLSFNHGEMFKAAWRCGRKVGTSRVYDLDKVLYFAKREKDRAAPQK